jgi:hypothetical protein
MVYTASRPRTGFVDDIHKRLIRILLFRFSLELFISTKLICETYKAGCCGVTSARDAVRSIAGSRGVLSKRCAIFQCGIYWGRNTYSIVFIVFIFLGGQFFPHDMLQNCDFLPLTALSGMSVIVKFETT